MWYLQNQGSLTSGFSRTSLERTADFSTSTSDPLTRPSRQFENTTVTKTLVGPGVGGFVIFLLNHMTRRGFICTVMKYLITVLH
jgi:hypothetical protein